MDLWDRDGGRSKSTPSGVRNPFRGGLDQIHRNKQVRDGRGSVKVKD